MKNKYYNVIFIFSKQLDVKVISEPHLADSQSDAINSALVSYNVLELILQGYKIDATSAVAYHETVAPLNSGTDCLVVRNKDDSLRYLYIDLRTEYPDEFKRDLQSLVSKHFANTPPIYPELNPTR